MPQYIVTVPVTMSISITVEATTKSVAIKQALAHEFTFKAYGEDAEAVEIGEWSMHHTIVEKDGECHAMQNKVYVEEA